MLQPFKAIEDLRARARGRARIVVAEDDTEMRRVVADALKKDGHEVLEASDGGRLLVRITSDRQIAGDDAFDLIVTDIRMPVCTGLQIVQALRESHCHVPVILMTAFGDDETRARAELLGALLFDKPFDVDDLRTAVLNVLKA